jgi:hypothetical protein
MRVLVNFCGRQLSSETTPPITQLGTVFVYSFNKAMLIPLEIKSLHGSLAKKETLHQTKWQNVLLQMEKGLIFFSF